jgi:ribonuclease P protein component
MPTFTKYERLCSSDHQKMLFSKGNFFFCHPFRVIYLKLTREKYLGVSGSIDKLSGFDNGLNTHAKCLISVPARKFKKAVDRNLIKRRIREAYRKNKSDFYTFLNREDYYCLLAFVYTGNQILSFIELDLKINVSLLKLMEKLKNDKMME